MTTVQSVEIVLENDGDMFSLFSDAVESFEVKSVSGDMLHKTKQQITITLAEGELLTRFLVDPFDDDEDEDESEEDALD